MRHPTFYHQPSECSVAFRTLAEVTQTSHEVEALRALESLNVSKI
jgi:hypothetical protein